MKKNEENWQINYMLLHAYIEQHHQLPDKKKKHFRRLLNWWKYNRRLQKAGTLSPARSAALDHLSGMRYITATSHPAHPKSQEEPRPSGAE